MAEIDPTLALFLASVDAAGGLSCMVEERRLGWLPEMALSSYAIILQEREHRELQEIADLLGTTRDNAESILTGAADEAPDLIKRLPPDDPQEREHIAGGIVKIAFRSAPRP